MKNGRRPPHALVCFIIIYRKTVHSTMPRTDDRMRRELRNVYDKNRRRVDKLAEKRGKGGSNDNQAPRRVVVSEKQTRQAGFGSGGKQVAQSRSRRGGPAKFADKSIFRSAASNRGNRGGDRNDRNDRNNNNNRVGGGGGGGGGRGRFGNRGNNNNNSNNNNQGGRGGNDRGRRALVKKAAERKKERLNSQRGGNQKGNNNKQQQQKPKPKRADKPAQKAPATFESLDAALMNYKGGQ
jgi:hypothetical protein